jgi:hypothetical protein
VWLLLFVGCCTLFVAKCLEFNFIILLTSNMNSEFLTVASFLAETPTQSPPHLHLYVSASQLCAEAGEGLFTSQHIPKGERSFPEKGTTLVALQFSIPP